MTLLGKIFLFNLSLVPLYFLFIIKAINLPNIKCFMHEYNNFIFYINILQSNLLSIVLILLIIFSFFIYKKFQNEIMDPNGLPKEFKNIQNIDFNHLTFVATYILPLLAFNLDGIRDLVFMITLLVFIGAIYIKTNLYYLNPVFVLLGIKVFDATDKEGKHVIIMTNEKNLSATEFMIYTKVGDIYFAKRRSA